ncbi:MAG: diguanylate cyclase [Burkholderiales bacterium]
MNSKFIFDPNLSTDELRGFTRTIAEIEWLLLILVLIFQLVLSPDQIASAALAMAMFFYTAFVLLFRYVNFYRQETYWKLAIETGMMIVFITWVLVYTGRLSSPLVNLYLLVVITSSLTLGRFATIVCMVVIGVCYLWLGYPLKHNSPFPSVGAEFVAQFAPMLLVAYITTMLSADTRRALEHVKTLSETDELTGTLNRRAFLSIAARTHSLAQRFGRKYSVIMIDSDSLKKTNDEYGHEAGDDLLKTMVQKIQDELRQSDLMSRYGGDEFVVLLPDTDSEGALLTAERIRQRIAAAPLLIGASRASISASMGVATYPDNGGDFDRVFEGADTAMYASKNSGKNKVTAAPMASGSVPRAA